MKKKVFLALVAVLVVIQIFRPAKNLSNENANDISTKYNVPEQVSSVLKVACNDCHSNRTEYPWYAEIQPVAWWLNSHVTDGKRHLNFSDFTSRPIAIQNHKFEETIEMVKEGEMPLASCTWFGLHHEANLTEEQRQVLVKWAEDQMESLKNQYPPDSLIMKRR